MRAAPVTDAAAVSPVSPTMVSVAIIFFNEERFLSEAIDSVLAQTHAAWRLLLIDDGSIDHSTKIAKEAAAGSLHRIRYVNHAGHANRGMSASRNLALVHAETECILFLDGDDTLAPDALREMVSMMDLHPEVAAVHGPMHVWYGWTGKPEDRALDHVQQLHMPLDRVVHPPEAVPIFLLQDSAVPSGNLFKCHVLRQAGGFEEEFRGMYEDQVVRVKVCLQHPVYVSSRVWYRYRRHAESCCTVMVQSGHVNEARSRFLSWVEEYCRNQRTENAEVWKALRLALRPYRYPRLTKWRVATIETFAWVRWEVQEGVKAVLRAIVSDRVWQWMKRWLAGR